jgi:hypothetical protein
MKPYTIVLKLIAYLSLIATAVAPVLFLMGKLELEGTKWIMLLSMITWFISASLLSVENRDKPVAQTNPASDESAVI